MTEDFCVLLLGASGKLGRMIRALWPAEGAPPLVPLTRADWPEGEPASALAARLGAGARGAAVIGAWGTVPGPGRDLQDNARLARRAQALGAALEARAVLHFSSAAVYGVGPGARDEAGMEDLPPPSAYGAAKRTMEAALPAPGAPGMPPAVALRLANVAGADSLAAACDSGAPVVLDRFADGQGPQRSYLGPRDLVRALLALLDLPPASLPRALNLAGPAPVAMAELLEARGAAFAWRPAPAEAVQRVELATARLSALLPGLSLAQSASAAGLAEQWDACERAQVVA